MPCVKPLCFHESMTQDQLGDLLLELRESLVPFEEQTQNVDYNLVVHAFVDIVVDIDREYVRLEQGYFGMMDDDLYDAYNKALQKLCKLVGWITVTNPEFKLDPAVFDAGPSVLHIPLD